MNRAGASNTFKGVAKSKVSQTAVTLAVFNRLSIRGGKIIGWVYLASLGMRSPLGDVAIRWVKDRAHCQRHSGLVADCALIISVVNVLCLGSYVRWFGV